MEDIQKAENEFDTDRPDIDWGHVSSMLDVVQKVAAIAPQRTNLSALATEEVKLLDEEVKAWADARAKRQAEIDAEYQAVVSQREQERMAEENEASATTAQRTEADRIARGKVEAEQAKTAHAPPQREPVVASSASPSLADAPVTRRT